jgi:peptidoglycan/LPS O-acetylase OafA/YrhL
MRGEQAPARLAGLDGLRAVAIAAVVLQHLLGTPGFPATPAVARYTGDLGALGVRAFFVLSGFLITTLLLQEHARRGAISLRGFYARRAYRILPALAALVAAVVALRAADAVRLDGADLLHAATFTMNHHPDRHWALGHLWSLSVEEQFYLAWPAVLVLAGPRRAAAAALAMVVAAPLLRLAAWAALPAPDDVIEEAFPCVMDAMATGSLLAALRPRLAAIGWYRRALRSRWFALAPAAVLAINLPLHYAVEYTVGPVAQHLLLAAIVDRCATVTTGAAARALASRPATWLGGLSYSLYLWQQPFLDRHAGAPWTAWPVNLGLALACAVACHRWIERPALALRQRRQAAAGGFTRR